MLIYKFLQNNLKISRVLTILPGIVIFSLFAFGFLKDAKSPYVLAANTPSPDAIAIRVMPNPEHYSISRWYSQQGFKGSPQSLTIDGYEALRDGRTVYVNAANVVGSDKLYTNIYLISYNQEAEAATKSILDQIISHWKFNTNIPDLFPPDLVNGQCSQATTTPCLIDADCSSGQYCTSQKAKITRDTKRLSRLAEIEMAIENYKNKRIIGYYPKLAAGTYLAGKTISTWPSWQQTLAKELGVGLPTDPINKLGDCPGYDSVTCWKEADKIFADPTPDNGEFNLPDNSHAFVYTGAADGSSYNICGIMESGLITGLEEGACAGSAVSYAGETGNTRPKITCGGLTGTATKEFKGYISASDLDKDKLAFTIDTTGTTWTGWERPEATPNAPILKDTVNSNQKEIYAAKAGDKGDYSFSVTVDDGRTEGQVTKTCYIKIMSNSVAPTCSADGCNGNCPPNCTTAAQDPDCGGAGCNGDGDCDEGECSAYPADCEVIDCCGAASPSCDSAVGETPENCKDCVSAVSGCVFPFDFPCTF